MKKVAVMCMALGLLPLPGRGAQPPSVDEELLEYLAEFGVDDDWAWFANSDDADSASDSSHSGQRAAQPPEKGREETKP